MFGDFNFQPDGPEYPCIVGPVGDYDEGAAGASEPEMLGDLLGL